jgi:hypothetical protein
MLGVFLDEKDLNAFFGAEESKDQNAPRHPLKAFWNPLAFTLNHDFFEALKKTFLETRVTDLQRIYAAYTQGMSIDEMKERGIIDKNVVVEPGCSIAQLIYANMRGEIKQTPWGKMEVINLYNEDFDQGYLNFVRDLQSESMARSEVNKWEEAKKYGGVDPSKIINPFDKIMHQHQHQNKINVSVGNPC